MSVLPIHLRNISLFSNELVSTGTTNSIGLNMSDLISYSIQYKWENGSTFSGTAYLQASNIPEPLLDNDWTTIQQSSLSISGSSGNEMINVEKPSYLWVRLVFNIISGNAQITSYFNAIRQ